MDLVKMERDWCDALTLDQWDALRSYAAQRGPTWKAYLRAEWQAGFRLDTDRNAVLRGLRNTHGPRWLKSFKLEG